MNAIVVITFLLVNKPIGVDYSDLTENTESSYKAPKFKVCDRVRITKYRNIFNKCSQKIGEDKYLYLILYWKLIHELRKLKIWMEKKNRLLWKRIDGAQIINELLSRIR